MCNYASSFTGSANNLIFYVSCHVSFIPATVIFDIRDDVAKKGAALNLPPFRTPGVLQFTEDEVMWKDIM